MNNKIMVTKVIIIKEDEFVIVPRVIKSLAAIRKGLTGFNIAINEKGNDFGGVYTTGVIKKPN
jgi:hypothetical protein